MLNAYFRDHQAEFEALGHCLQHIDSDGHGFRADAVAREHLLAIRRAGADFVLTYFARAVAESMQ